MILMEFFLQRRSILKNSMMAIYSMIGREVVVMVMMMKTKRKVSYFFYFCSFLVFLLSFLGLILVVLGEKLGF